jgi:Spy/CpxP family protein refolding chaperone
MATLRSRREQECSCGSITLTNSVGLSDLNTMLDIATPRLRATSWLLVAYLLGIAVGALTGQLIFNSVHALPPAPLTRYEQRAQFVERLAGDVSLTDIQKHSVDQILNDASVQCEAIRRQTETRMTELHTATRERVRSILAPEQRTKFNELLYKWDRERNLQNPR